MKKNYALNAAFAVILLISSCSKDKLAVVKNDDPSPKKPNSAVDGLFDVLGYGYNVTGEYGNSSAATYKVIDVARLKNDQPNRVEIDLSKKQEGKIYSAENVESYSKKISATLKATVGFALFKSTITGSYSDASSFSGRYVYSSYDLIIQEKRNKFNATTELLKNYITPEFTTDVQNNSAAYIVGKYGTHVLSDIILGAKLQVLYQSETSKADRTTAAAAGLDVGIGAIFSINTGLNYDKSSTSQNSSQKLHYKTYGGDPSRSLIGTLSLDQTAPTVNIANWQSSSTVANAELIEISNDGLIPISDFITDAAKKTEVENYIKQYLIDNQVVVDNDYTSQLVNVNLFSHQSGKGHHYLSTGMVDDWNYWTFLGSQFRAYNKAIPGAVPVNVFYSPKGEDHFFTLGSVDDFSWWRSEGVAFYAYATQVPGTIPIYSHTSRDRKDHFYTPDGGSLDTRYWLPVDGVAFYAYPSK